MHQNTFGGRALPGTTGGAYVLHQTPNCNGRPPKRWDGRRGGLHLRGTEGRREGKGIPPNVKVSTINTIEVHRHENKMPCRAIPVTNT